MAMIGEWLYNEASSGTTPTDLHDSSPGDPNDLPITYTSTAAWAAIAAGCGLGLGTLGTAGAISDPITTGNKVIDALNGSKTLTWEIVGNFTGFPGVSGGTVCDVLAQSPAVDSQCGIYPAGNTVNWDIWIGAGDALAPASFFAKPSAVGVHVVHVTLNSAELAANDRTKAYIDAVRQTVTDQNGIPLDFQLTYTLVSNILQGLFSDGTFGITGTIYYCSLWDEELSPAVITTRAAGLLQNNDRDPGLISPGMMCFA